MKITYIEFFGYFAAILTTLAFIPQLIKKFSKKVIVLAIKIGFEDI